MGAIALLARDRVVALASPNRCAAALDLLSIAIVRQWPEMPVGQLFVTLQPIVIIVAVACFAWWCYRATQSVAVSASIAFAFGLSPAFSSRLAPPTETAAIGVCALLALVVSSAGIESVPSRRGVVLSLLGLALAALVVPAWFLACAFVACWLVWRLPLASHPGARLGISIAAGVFVSAAPFIMLRATHVPALARGVSWYGCALPTTIESWPLPASSALAWIFGPVVLALAALGLMVMWRRVGVVRILGLACILALASIPAPDTPSDARLAPLMVAAWSAAALGMLELTTMTSRARGGLISATLLLCAVPLLEALRVRAYERDDIVSVPGQQRATLGAVTSILNLVPDGTRFVEEDASIDLLLRAVLVGGRRATKPFVVIPSTRRSVTRALAEGVVYAFPRGQELLSVRGFALQQDESIPIRGVARVVSARSCETLGSSWTDLGNVGGHGRIAIVVETERSQGPVVLYFGGPTEYEPGPDSWAPRVHTGFEVALFDSRTAAATGRLRAEALAQQLEGQPVFSAPFVSRMLIRRTPLSPMELPIVLGPPRPVGIGRLREDAAPGSQIAVCDAPAIAVSRF